MVDSVVTPREGARGQISEATQVAKTPPALPVGAAGQSTEDGQAARAAGAARAETVKDLGSAVEQVELEAQRLNRSIRFSVDEGSGRTVIRVIDRETDELIRQIPPEDFLAIAESLREQGRGLIIESV